MKIPRIYVIPWRKVGNPVLRFLLRCTHGAIERIVGLRKIDRIYFEMKQLPEEIPFREKSLLQLGVTYSFASAALAKIPKTGPVVVVCNHPFGGVEGIVLLSLLNRVRPDVKAMANYILGVFTEMRDDFILVDPFAGRNSAVANIRPVKESIRWLKDGHLLIVFPSGEVSSFDKKVLRVRDPKWSPMVASLVRKTGASVVPLFLPGRNSVLFNLAGFIHPLLRTIRLPREMLGMGGRTLKIEIGSVLKPKDLEPYAASDEKLIRYLRFRSYLLGERKPHRLFQKSHLQQEPVIAAEPVEVLANELASLPPERRVIETNEMEVWCAPAAEIPHILQEIGRLREITFRLVGEGTGNEIDLDDFDPYYYHLFLWSKAKQEIVGCYRLGLTDEIIREHGITGLYTRTLFKFDERLIDALGPVMEMGRSFVRLEYQRAITSLPLLWKGIAVFVARKRKYKTLLGPVSITNEYREASRCMMIRCLQNTCMATENVRLVSPRIPPKPPCRAEWTLPEYADFLGDIEAVSEFVSEIEPDGKGIPILINQYMKLAGRLLSFNLDPDFSSVVDGFIAVNVTQTPYKILRRYMGPEIEDYYRYHGKPLPVEEN